MRTRLHCQHLPECQYDQGSVRLVWEHVAEAPSPEVVGKNLHKRRRALHVGILHDRAEVIMYIVSCDAIKEHRHRQ